MNGESDYGIDDLVIDNHDDDLIDGLGTDLPR